MFRVRRLIHRLEWQHRDPESLVLARGRIGCRRCCLDLSQFFWHLRVAEFVGVEIENVDAQAVFDFHFAQIMQCRLPITVLLEIFGNSFG